MLCASGGSLWRGAPTAPTPKRRNQGPPRASTGREHSCGETGGPQALRGKARGPPPLSTVSGRQHPPREAGANQSQMCEQRKMLIILTRKSPIYREIMK